MAARLTRGCLLCFNAGRHHLFFSIFGVRARACARAQHLSISISQSQFVSINVSLTFSLNLNLNLSISRARVLDLTLNRSMSGQEAHRAGQQGNPHRGRARDFAAPAKTRRDHDARRQRAQRHFPGPARRAARRDAQSKLWRGLKPDFTCALLLNCTLNPNSNEFFFLYSAVRMRVGRSAAPRWTTGRVLSMQLALSLFRARGCTEVALS